jgi:hypothetical protein
MIANKRVGAELSITRWGISHPLTDSHALLDAAIWASEALHRR